MDDLQENADRISANIRRRESEQDLNQTILSNVSSNTSDTPDNVQNTSRLITFMESTSSSDCNDDGNYSNWEGPDESSSNENSSPNSPNKSSHNKSSSFSISVDFVKNLSQCTPKYSNSNETNDSIKLLPLPPSSSRKMFSNIVATSTPLADNQFLRRPIKRKRVIFDDLNNETMDDRIPTTSYASQIVDKGNIMPNINTSKTQIFSGFTTATGEAITIDKTAVERAKKFIMNEDNYSIPNNNIHTLKPQIFSGFTTATGTAITIDKIVLEKAEKFIMNDGNNPIPNNNSNNQKTKIFSGFTTATGTAITVDKTVLEKAQKFIMKDGSNTIPNNNINNQKTKIFSGFTTATGEAITINKAALNRAKKYARNDVNISSSNHNKSDTSNTQIFTGFTTGKGEAITIDKASLEKAKKFIMNNVCYSSPSTSKMPKQHIIQFESRENDMNKSTTSNKILGDLCTKPSSNYIQNIKENGSSSINLIAEAADHEDQSNVSVKNLDELSKSNSCMQIDEHSIDYDDFNELFTQERKNRRVNNRYRKKPVGVLSNPGYLFNAKQSNNRISLLDMVNGAYPKRYTINELIEHGVSEEVANIDTENCLDLEFDMSKIYGPEQCKNGIDYQDGFLLKTANNCKVGFLEIVNCFMENKKIPCKIDNMDRFRNHFKCIVTKFAMLEQSFPITFGGKLLNPENILLQLKYRYEREILLGHRSALHQIKHGGMSPSDRIVVYVSQINKDGKVELCDGWNYCNSAVDYILSEAINKGKINVGTKLMISGATFVPSLGMSKSMILQLHANGTRRVKWYTKLGKQKNSNAFSISINSIKSLGGDVPMIKGIIVRKYPIMYKVYDDNSSILILHERKFKELVEEEQETMEDERPQLATFRKSRVILSSSIRKLKVIPLQVLCLTDTVHPEKLIIVEIKHLVYPVPVKEGIILSLSNLHIDGEYLRNIKLSTTADTKIDHNVEFVEVPDKYRKKYTPIHILENNFSSLLNEIDTVGLVILIRLKKQRDPAELVYLVDDKQNFLCVEFYEGIEFYGYKNHVETGQILSFCNIYYEGNTTSKGIPKCDFTLKSFISVDPLSPILKETITTLSTTIKSNNPEGYNDICLEKLQNL